MGRKSAKSIQSHLIFSFIIAILVPVIITSTVGMKLIYNQIITRAETKTISDLNSAREIYKNKILQIESITRLTAARSLIVTALIEQNKNFLERELQKTLRRERLDILTIVDRNGTVVCRGRNLGLSGDNLGSDKFIRMFSI